MPLIFKTPENDQPVVLTCNLLRIPPPGPTYLDTRQFLRDICDRNAAMQKVLNELEHHHIMLECNHVGWDPEDNTGRMWLHLSGKGSIVSPIDLTAN